MEDQLNLEDGFMEQIDWDNLFVDFPEAESLFDMEPPVLADSQSNEAFSNSSPDSMSSWIGELEDLLMKDDDNKAEAEPEKQFQDEFFADILADSPLSGSGEVVDGADEKELNVSSDRSVDGGSEVVEKEKTKEAEKTDLPEANDDGDDPVSKKRRRQLRNRDAAVRSRERRKTYVKDLEMKGKYLEGECRRLGRLLQCFVAENTALRVCLQKGGAYDASSAKQESAVLLLESLLLGSLLWFLGIMCLFPPPTLPKPLLLVVPPENVEKEALEEVAPRGAGGKLQSFVRSRRCRASRTKIKPAFHDLRILA